MKLPAFILLAGTALLAALPGELAHGALTFDLRADSGSQVTIHGPKSVSVNQHSVGGWIDFELYAFVNGANNNASDESIQFFVGNMYSTHIGHGSAGGSMVNSGDVTSRVRRGIVSPMDHHGYSDGWIQNLDDDSDLEIGGTGLEQTEWLTRLNSTIGMIGGRGDPFRVRNYDGDNAVAEFLLYRFTLAIDSFPAQSLSDMTSIYFSHGPVEPMGLWFEDQAAQGNTSGGVIDYGSSVLIHSAQTPEELAMIPEPGTLLLGLIITLGAVRFVNRHAASVGTKTIEAKVRARG